MDFLQWLPAIIVLVGTVATFVRMQEAQKSTDKRLDDHEQRLRVAERAITGLEVFDELQKLRVTAPVKGSDR